jgi:arsenite methyltransferase
MSDGKSIGAGVHASSTGQYATGAAWLDIHFEACRPEYEAMLRSVGIQPGWRVLDAGCGSGSYLPLIAEAVGSTGAITALDLAPDNVAVVERRVTDWDLAAPVEARTGSVTGLPYADDAFDAVWCAATTQYLTDGELAATLAEFRRVVRPGGIVALKDFDSAMWRFLPAPAGIYTHIVEAMAQGGAVQAAGCLRAPALGSWLRRSGLGAVWSRTTLVERNAPLGPAERQHWGDLLTTWPSIAAGYELPAADRALWARLTDPAERAHLLDDPDFYCSEGHVLVVGRVPERG